MKEIYFQDFVERLKEEDVLCAYAKSSSAKLMLVYNEKNDLFFGELQGFSGDSSLESNLYEFMEEDEFRELKHTLEEADMEQGMLILADAEQDEEFKLTFEEA